MDGHIGLLIVCGDIMHQSSTIFAPVDSGCPILIHRAYGLIRVWRAQSLRLLIDINFVVTQCKTLACCSNVLSLILDVKLLLHLNLRMDERTQCIAW
jgi:hypothetical protein